MKGFSIDEILSSSSSPEPQQPSPTFAVETPSQIAANEATLTLLAATVNQAIASKATSSASTTAGVSPSTSKHGKETNAGGAEAAPSTLTNIQHQFPMFRPPRLRKHKAPRKNRTAFSQTQIAVLEKRFAIKSYLTCLERIELANRLSLTDTQIKIWFQNRRAKERRIGASRPIITQLFREAHRNIETSVQTTHSQPKCAVPQKQFTSLSLTLPSSAADPVNQERLTSPDFPSSISSKLSIHQEPSHSLQETLFNLNVAQPLIVTQANILNRSVEPQYANNMLLNALLEKQLSSSAHQLASVLSLPARESPEKPSSVQFPTVIPNFNNLSLLLLQNASN